MSIEIVSASAGTGKTHRLSMALVDALLRRATRPEGVVAITYTKKAAAELESRIREALLEQRMPDLAARIRDGYIGTIHAACHRLLCEFALEAGLPPSLEPMPVSEGQLLFNEALAGVVQGHEAQIEKVATRLCITDWRHAVAQIVNLARDNGMGARELEDSARKSRESLFRLLPPPTLDGDHYERGLRELLERIVPQLEARAGESGKAAERASAAAGALEEARRSGLPAWKDQVQLANALSIRALEPIAGPLVKLVGDHLRARRFHADLEFMQGSDVAEALRARLDLVLVDELQDASPIQLAIISRLAELAPRSIWVGDRKQAIFGFQGSDPELMTAAVQAALQGRPPDILDKSFRARRPLIDFTSELFVRALAPHGFPEAEVRVEAAKAEPPEMVAQHVIECWTWQTQTVSVDGRKVKATEAHAVAAGVEELLREGPLVRERNVGAEAEGARPLRKKDIAILAFRNDRCAEIAAALRMRGIAVKVSVGGLMDTPEAQLARAGLAMLADPSDGVAALEVSYLSGGAGSDPDAWLSARLREEHAWQRAREQAERTGQQLPPRPEPFDDDRAVAALRAALSRTHGLSPAEALDLVIDALDLGALFRTWPDPEQRLANLEALRSEARAYEDVCRLRRTACTPLGLADHLARLKPVRLGLEADEFANRQAMASEEDAVTVSTWHRAKGLEWPLVVLSDLDWTREREVFEIAVEPAERFDAREPLRDRWVRH